MAAALFVLAFPAPGVSAIHPAPEPFTLNSYDAIQAVAMIRRVGLLIEEQPGERRGRIISIAHPREVEAVFVGIDENAPGAAHRQRWDITIRGEPLDWRHTFIRYGGRMVNLQALFTYRNQELPPGLSLVPDRW